MRTTPCCVIALLVTPFLAPSAATSGEWLASSAPDQHRIVASYKDADGGSLLVACDTASKLVSIAVQDPRASWPQGQIIEVMTLPDTGQVVSPSHGHVTGPTQFVVKDQAAFDLWTMRQAKNVFKVSAGDYVRSYPAANFRAVVEPVLKACGVHW